MTAARASAAGTLLVATAATLVGCGGGSPVMRVVDGRTVVGPEVSAEAYAAALEGGRAAAAGELRPAAEALRRAADDGAGDGYLRALAAQATCEAGQGAAGLDLARRARREPHGEAPGAVAEARCAAASGRRQDAVRLADEALAWRSAPDPEVEAWVMRIATSASRRARGPRLYALTVEEPGAAAAWEALAAWAEDAGRPWTEARARGARALGSEGQTAEAAAAVARLARVGAVTAARHLAAALVDHAPVRRWAPRGEVTLVEALAVDEALARGDGDEARRRASRGRMDPAELLARALLLRGDGASLPAAGDLLAALARSQPAARLAHLALRARAGDLRPLARLHDEGWTVVADAEGSAAPPTVPAAVAVVAARAAARVYGPEEAQALVRPLRIASVRDGDDLVAKAAVDGVAHGRLPATLLSPDGEARLALRRGEPVDAAARARHGPRLSVPVALLTEVWAAPPEGRPRLVPALQSAAAVAPADGLLRVALALCGALGAPAEAAAALLAGHADEALAVAVAHRLAAESGAAPLVARATQLLAGLAATAEERARGGLVVAAP